MKNASAGVAGAARIYQMNRADLVHAEKHGKRLDATGKSRAVNNAPPVTSTGLEVKALFEAHIAGAFVLKAHSKAMHVLIQFPTELVDGNDPENMLHHARAFTRRVFGNDAIFADRVDRDEKSQHVVDVFVAPKYNKRTKHQSKVAVSMTHHLKALAVEYGQPTGPHGCARALQDALFEYFRDDMGLAAAVRGTPKQMPGPDWKSSEQQRVEELAELARLAAENKEALALRDDRITAREQALQLREAATTELERNVALREVDAAVLVDKAKATQLAAEVARHDAEVALAEVQRSAVAAAKERASHVRQHSELALLTKALDDQNGLNLRRSDVTITMKTDVMTEGEKETYRGTWTAIGLAVARQLAGMLERARALLRSITDREAQLKAKEADQAAKEAQAQRVRAEADAARRANDAVHRANVDRLDIKLRNLEQREIVVADNERKAAAAMAEALRKHAEADNARQEAERGKREQLNWAEIVRLIVKDELRANLRDDGYVRMAQTIGGGRHPAPEQFAETLVKQPPAWVSGTLTKFNLSVIQKIEANLLKNEANQLKNDALDLSETLQDQVSALGSLIPDARKADVGIALRKADRFRYNNDRSI